MEPETSLPQQNSEKLTVQHVPNTEREPLLKLPELDPKMNAERYEQIAENRAIASDVGLTTMIPAPVIAADDVDENTTTRDTLIIRKDDLIEKEWVEKAKKIVAETQNNPYQREQNVSILQKDYLKKRYGKELGVAE